MITPEAMSKVRIVAPKRLSYDTIHALYNLNLFHVKNYHKGEMAGLDTGMPLLQAEELSKTLLTLRATKAALGITERIERVELPLLSQDNFGQMRATITQLHDEVTGLNGRVKQHGETLMELRMRHAIAKALARLDIDVALLGKVRQMAFFIGTVKESASLKKKIDVLISGYELKHAVVNGEHLIVLFVRKEDEMKARSVLSESGFVSLAIDEYKGVRMAALDKSIAAGEKGRATAQKKIGALRSARKSFLLEHELVLEEEIKKAELPLQFATTAQSFIATGYVPTAHFHKIAAELRKATNDTILVEEEEIGHEEQVPVKLNNPAPVRNFEALTRLYELPHYLEVDPSVLMFVTFPIFFGFMLGDVGYGLTTLLLFWFLKKRFPEGKQLLNVLVYASVVTILFGFAFGEYFGFEHVGMETGERLCGVGICFDKEIVEAHGGKEIVYSFPRLIARTHSAVNIFGYEILTVLFVGAVVGAIHLNIGFLVGFFNVWRAHGLVHAALEKLSWLVLEAGIALMVLSVLKMIIVPAWVGVALFVVALGAIAASEGVKGLIEIPALLSNTLSYMRLGAVGLASVVLAVVINENLAKPLLAKGGFFIVLGVIIMIVGHTINIGLGILGPFLHSIRLHYVEFFSKFYHGGGQEYQPFGYTRGA